MNPAVSFKTSFKWLENNTQLQFFMRLFSGRVVGGAVRNGLLQNIYPDQAWQVPLDDLDLATIYAPSQMIEIADLFKLKHIPTGIDHGTITVLGRIFNEDYLEYISTLIESTEFAEICQKHKLYKDEIIKAVEFLKTASLESVDVTQVYEITTLRIDVETDGRHALVEFTQDWKEDAARRDFTMNAMYVDYDGNVYDYFTGIEDLKNQLVRFVGEPSQRIQEDYLRIFRFFRFNAWYGKQPWSSNCVQACKENMTGLTQVASERLWREWDKLMKTDNPWDVIELMNECKVFETLKWPEVDLHKVKKHLEVKKYATNLGAMALFEGDWKVVKMSGANLKYINSIRNASLFEKADWLAARYENGEKWIEDKQFYDGVDASIQLITFKANKDFPVTGSDLITKGIQPGPQMGEKLIALKKLWFENDMNLQKEELLERLI